MEGNKGWGRQQSIGGVVGSGPGAMQGEAEFSFSCDESVEIRTLTLLQVGLGPSSEQQATAELRPVRHK